MRVPDGLPSFGHVLRFRAAEAPHRPTFTMLGDVDGTSTTLTDADMDGRARAVAAALQGDGAFGERALIVCPPGLDYVAAFYGCLYAGAIAVPACPPGFANPTRSLERIAAIVDHAAPRFLLTTSAMLERRDLLVALAPALAPLRWIAVDALRGGLADAWREPPLRPELIAFLQYTSGSTGRPKGVAVSHANLLHNTEQMRRLLRGGCDDRHVAWLPPYHDMGLIAGILMVSQFGMTVTLMSPLTFVKQPYRWLRTLSDNRATITGGAPFGFDLAVRKVTDEQVATLDLRSVRVACIAAEPVRPGTLERFLAKFGPAGWRPETFLPCYGLAESTLMATGGTADATPVVRHFSRAALHVGRLSPAAGDDTVALVGNGPVIDGMDLAIVDTETRRPCASNELGEVWLSGRSVAAGYWEAPDDTERHFRAVLADAHERRRRPGPFLRTGDVGAVVDGELFVTGRMKDVLIVDGANHHAEDVEATIERCQPCLHGHAGAVFAIDTGQAERVVAVQELTTRGVDREATARAIHDAVAAEHGISLAGIVMVRARTLPRTTSGKIQRTVCRTALLAGSMSGVVHVWRHARWRAMPPVAARAVVADRREDAP